MKAFHLRLQCTLLNLTFPIALQVSISIRLISVTISLSQISIKIVEDTQHKIKKQNHSGLVSSNKYFIIKLRRKCLSIRQEYISLVELLRYKRYKSLIPQVRKRTGRRLYHTGSSRGYDNDRTPVCYTIYQFVYMKDSDVTVDRFA